MQKKKKQYSSGVFIIFIGVVILLGKLGVLSFAWKLLWPLLLLAPGILLHLVYFAGYFSAALLIPGGMLITYSLMFIYCNLFGWQSMGYLWPGFILGIAVGLYEYYWYETGRPRSFLIAAILLAIISILFFGLMLLFTSGVYILALVLILIGAFMLMRRPNAW